MDALAFIDYAGVSSPERSAIEALVREHTSLRSVLNWLRRRTPPQDIDDVVTQDEYTHDVIVRFERGLHLVYDTS